ncbi:helix-turn-helix domain-containing protein [Gilliamella apis]|nr:helix-turn-helix domain-containing protein [uncultured Gilliamella sp.]WLS94152.1 helix-turn-helix domain-containing protein [Gilliamella apis]WLT06664.1 helix-turn-helix domain-containing protein [Gilliamella apis]
MKNNPINTTCCGKEHQPITCCPVDATINMIGGKYKSLILWKLMTETTLRFSQLQKEIPTATPKMLTQQLRELEANGLIHRHVYPVVPPKVEYSLTNFGKSIRPVLESMYIWGSDYLNNQGLQVNCSMTAITDPQ